MSDFYTDKRDGVVKNSLTKHGTAMTLVVPADGTFVPQTGGFTPGTDKSYSVQGLVGNYLKTRKTDTVQAKSRYIYLSPSGMTVTPMPGHKLRVENVEYEITSVDSVAPAGTVVLYQLQVQQP